MTTVGRATDRLGYACAACRRPFEVPAEGEGEHVCAGCGTAFTYGPRYLKYDFDRLLFQAFKGKYLANKVLNNNGFLSYQWLQDGSLSLPEREDVSQFRAYISQHAPRGRLLDIGCGPLPQPGYLDFRRAADYEFVGLDPIDDRGFDGLRIVGASEFMPFPDDSFDAVVFATSMDHVCSLTDTLAEARRVLKPGGAVLIWMGDREMSWWTKLRRKISAIRHSLIKGYRVDRYQIYPNNVVLAIPPGAVDPFHSYFEGPKTIGRVLRKVGFKEDDVSYHHRDLVFLCYRK